MKKKQTNEKNRDYAASSTTLSSGEDDSVFTSSTVVSTSSSIQRTTEMIEAVLLSPKQFPDRQWTCGAREWICCTSGVNRPGIYNDDPFARQSKLMKKSSMKMNIEGDRDTWEERVQVNKKTGKKRSFFYSANTGFRVKDEPPTGASYIIYYDK